MGFEARWYTGWPWFDASGRHIYMLSAQRHDKSVVLRIDWTTGEEQVIFASERADPSHFILNSKTFEPEAVGIDVGLREWTALSPSVEGELSAARSSRSVTISKARAMRRVSKRS